MAQNSSRRETLILKGQNRQTMQGNSSYIERRRCSASRDAVHCATSRGSNQTSTLPPREKASAISMAQKAKYANSPFYSRLPAPHNDTRKIPSSTSTLVPLVSAGEAADMSPSSAAESVSTVVRLAENVRRRLTQHGGHSQPNNRRNSDRPSRCFYGGGQLDECASSRIEEEGAPLARSGDASISCPAGERRPRRQDGRQPITTVVVEAEDEDEDYVCCCYCTVNAGAVRARCERDCCLKALDTVAWAGKVGTAKNITESDAKT